MASTRSRWAVLTAVAGLGVVALGAAPAAARPATSVLSDRVRFNATATVSAGMYMFKTTSCTLVSDGETTPYPCRMSGQFPVLPPQTGSATLVSADGITTWTYTLTCLSPCKSVAMKGAGVEADAPEGGKVQPKYPARMHGIWTATAAGTLAGTVVVRESSTAP